jgi:hypothetical protein
MAVRTDVSGHDVLSSGINTRLIVVLGLKVSTRAESGNKSSGKM